MNESMNHTLNELPEEPKVVISQPQESVEQTNSFVQPIDPAAESDQQGWFKSSVQSAKRVVQGAVLTVEMLPITNEGARYGALAATEVLTRNPLVGAAVLGGSTLLIEGAAALAASDFITGKTSNQVFEWLNEKINSRIPNETKMSKPIEAGAALALGTPILMAVKQRENPNRSLQEARKHGLLTAAWVAGVCAVEGAMISEGIGGYADSKKIAALVAATGVFIAIPKWAKKQLNKRNDNNEHTQNIDHELPIKIDKDKTNNTLPKYDLTPEELNELEEGLINLAKEKYPEDGLVSIWISPKHKFANLVRVHEASYFPEVEEVSEEDENHTLFMVVVDTRPASNRIVHAATVTGVSYKSENETLVDGPDQTDKMTGLYTVDSLIELGNFTAKEFYDYYENKDIDLKKSIAVETNFRVGESVEKYNGFRPSDLAYLTFFKMVEKRNPETDKAMIIATINRAQAISFQRVGIAYEPLMGRSDLRTEESLLGKDSQPVALIYNATNIALFKRMGLQLPEIFI